MILEVVLVVLELVLVVLELVQVVLVVLQVVLVVLEVVLVVLVVLEVVLVVLVAALVVLVVVQWVLVGQVNGLFSYRLNSPVYKQFPKNTKMAGFGRHEELQRRKKEQIAGNGETHRLGWVPGP